MQFFNVESDFDLSRKSNHLDLEPSLGHIRALRADLVEGIRRRPGVSPHLKTPRKEEKQTFFSTSRSFSSLVF